LSKLPVVSWRDVIKALKKVGFVPIHQSGSHIILKRDNEPPISVPRRDELKKGLLHAIIIQSGLTVEEFNQLR
jgi:predicted RNA binding protein YcfA (HicA-like mRNA interferase family)